MLFVAMAIPIRRYIDSWYLKLALVTVHVLWIPYCVQFSFQYYEQVLFTTVPAPGADCTLYKLNCPQETETSQNSKVVSALT